MQDDTPDGGWAVAADTETATEDPSEAACDRCFSSRRHFARRFENQTWNEDTLEYGGEVKINLDVLEFSPQVDSFWKTTVPGRIRPDSAFVRIPSPGTRSDRR